MIEEGLILPCKHESIKSIKKIFNFFPIHPRGIESEKVDDIPKLNEYEISEVIKIFFSFF